MQGGVFLVPESHQAPTCNDNPMSYSCVALIVLTACATTHPSLVNHAAPVVTETKVVHVPRPAIEPASESEEPWWLDPLQPRRRIVTSTSITILDTISFIGASAMLDANAFPMLDAIASTLSGNRDIRVMEVVAYGADGAHPQQLGEQRARSIKTYLVQRGVDGARLRLRGEAVVPKGSDGRPTFLILERASD